MSVEISILYTEESTKVFEKTNSPYSTGLALLYAMDQLSDKNMNYEAAIYSACKTVIQIINERREIRKHEKV